MFFSSLEVLYSICKYIFSDFDQEVQELLESWSNYIELCHKIFVRVPQYNKHMLFGGKKPLLNRGN